MKLSLLLVPVGLITSLSIPLERRQANIAGNVMSIVSNSLAIAQNPSGMAANIQNIVQSGINIFTGIVRDL